MRAARNAWRRTGVALPSIDSVSLVEKGRFLASFQRLRARVPASARHSPCAQSAISFSGVHFGLGHLRRRSELLGTSEARANSHVPTPHPSRLALRRSFVRKNRLVLQRLSSQMRHVTPQEAERSSAASRERREWPCVFPVRRALASARRLCPHTPPSPGAVAPLRGKASRVGGHGTETFEGAPEARSHAALCSTRSTPM